MPSYQPEAAYQIFMRALFNKDIATGTIDLTDDYTTEGPRSTWHIQNDVLPQPEPECYILEAMSCTVEQLEMAFNGTAVFKDWILVGKEADDSVNNDEEGKVLLFEDGKQKTMR